MSDYDFACGLVYGLAHNRAALRHRLLSHPLTTAKEVNAAALAELPRAEYMSLRTAIMNSNQIARWAKDERA